MTTTPRILIVDDEERFRQTLAKLLTVRGLDVTTLGSGQEALDALGQEQFDVIVLDVRMPGMNGIETLAEIKKLNPMVEVIILTGHASVDAAVDIMKLGGYDYLLKPCFHRGTHGQDRCRLRTETGPRTAGKEGLSAGSNLVWRGWIFGGRSLFQRLDVEVGIPDQAV